MLIRRGARGDRVKDIQRALNDKGFGQVGVDGIFGKGTELAVKRFQKASGLGVDGIVGPNTMTALTAEEEPKQPEVSDEPPPIIGVLEEKGYEVYTDGQINTIGVRSSNTIANSFDDEMHLVWVKNGLWQHKKYRITTDPGTYCLEHPEVYGRAAGTAIMVPGSYRAYKWDMHRGKYETLCQRASPIRVWRDGNRDNILSFGHDDDPGIEGWYGVNLHHAGANSTRVDKWSAGCQVFARIADWEEAVKIWKASEAEVFTYTLITEDDLSKET
jgi:peptidoglycan hydrolase-like protein with peptidoglycan-binding domain